jgi:hypothetical protein
VCPGIFEVLYGRVVYWIVLLEPTVHTLSCVAFICWRGGYIDSVLFGGYELNMSFREKRRLVVLFLSGVVALTRPGDRLC